MINQGLRATAGDEFEFDCRSLTGITAAAAENLLEREAVIQYFDLQLPGILIFSLECLVAARLDAFATKGAGTQ